MLSILIPVYNYSVYQLVIQLSEQAERTDVPYEILIADDASTSQKQTIENQKCSSLPHCRLHRFDHNKGRTYTRNFLAQQAQYEWVLFLDADVLPKSDTFLEKYIQQFNQADLIFGGTSYTVQKPNKKEILRWKYGKVREAKSLKERQENPYYSIISQAFLVRKTLFLQANQDLKNVYGMDSLFTENLKSLHADIKHIENPVIHLGLEDNRKFLEKTKKGLKSLIQFEQEGKVSLEYRPVQQAFLKLEKAKLTKVYLHFFRVFKTSIEKNLLSSHPSLFLFDLYKLYFYAQLKNEESQI